MAKTFVRAITSFVAAAKKKGEIGPSVNEGQIVPSDDPIVRAAPGLFVPLDDDYSAPVEQATAAPGEKRSLPIPKAVKK